MSTQQSAATSSEVASATTDNSLAIDRMLKTHRFCMGPGQLNHSGCWMSFGNSLVHGIHNDRPASVDESIASLCILINDLLPDECRNEIITEFGTWLPFGTKGDTESTERRRKILIRSAVKTWAADAVEAAGWPELRTTLHALSFHDEQRFYDNDVVRRSNDERWGDLLEHLDHLTREEEEAPRNVAGIFAKFAVMAAFHAAQHFRAFGSYRGAAAVGEALKTAEQAIRARLVVLLPNDGGRPSNAEITRVKDAVHPDYIVSRVLPVLREMIDAGPRCPVEPVASSERLQLCGVAAEPDVWQSTAQKEDAGQFQQ